MSSADSSVLSAASMFAHNIWKLTIRPAVRLNPLSKWRTQFAGLRKGSNHRDASGDRLRWHCLDDICSDDQLYLRSMVPVCWFSLCNSIPTTIVRHLHAILQHLWIASGICRYEGRTDWIHFYDFFSWFDPAVVWRRAPCESASVNSLPNVRWRFRNAIFPL